IIQRMLQFRSTVPVLFEEGAYLPLEVEGAHARHAIAFARVQDEGDAALVIVPRLCANLLATHETERVAQPMVPPARWEDTAVLIPPTWRHSTLRQVLSADDNVVRVQNG